jgi:hypothetical protein
MDCACDFFYNPRNPAGRASEIGEAMTGAKLSILVAVVSLIGAISANGQMGMRGVRLPPGFFNPVVGGGASYETTDSNGRKSGLDLALIGKESVNGKDGYWIEWTMPDSSMGTILAKELLVMSDPITISRVVMQMAGRPPMVMPEQMTGNMDIKPADIRTKADDLGKESMTVPAGTFSCEHYRAKDSGDDTWISSKVSPIGLVKDQSKDKTRTTVLLKTYTDAKDKITGTPQPFNPMMMMPPRQ